MQVERCSQVGRGRKKRTKKDGRKERTKRRRKDGRKKEGA
jgi:hypothetical protein